jgi:exosortase F-associated protein
MTTRQLFLVVSSAGGLIAVFIWQQTNIAVLFGVESEITNFIINRSARFVLNDLFALLLIYGLFLEKKFIKITLVVQAAAIGLFLIPYFILKINFPLYDGPLLSFMHRLILHPTLALLLIPAFYFHNWKLYGRN